MRLRRLVGAGALVALVTGLGMAPARAEGPGDAKPGPVPTLGQRYPFAHERAEAGKAGGVDVVVVSTTPDVKVDGAKYVDLTGRVRLVHVDAGGLEKILATPGVDGVSVNDSYALADTVATPAEPETLGLASYSADSGAQQVGAEDASVHGAGLDGSNTVTFILDSGVAKAHAAMVGQVIGEACFNAAQSDCSGGTTSSTATGTGEPCTYPGALGSCYHGTNVAGQVVSTDASIPGVAKGGKVVSVRVSQCISCGTDIRIAVADLASAIAWADTNRASFAGYTATAINMSLSSGGPFVGECTGGSLASVVATAVSHGLSVVEATGNEGFTTGVGNASCTPGIFAVGGAVANTGGVLGNMGGITDVLAPSNNILSIYAPGGYAYYSGTSEAAPITAGALAVLREAYTGSTAKQREAALRYGGTMTYDTRAAGTYPAGSYARERIDMVQALKRLGEIMGHSSTKFNAVGPIRAVDTRFGFGLSGYVGQVPAGDGNAVFLDVANTLGRGATDAEAVLLNLTAVNVSSPLGGTFFKVWPSGGSTPTVSNLNINNGDTKSAAVWAKVGTDGYVKISSQSGTVDIIVDVLGYFGSSSDYVPVNPTRVFDTRDNTGGVGTSPIGAGGTLTFDPRGVGGVPSSGVDAVVYAYTAISNGATYVASIPNTTAAPDGTSIMNLGASQTRNNVAVTKLGTDGKIKIYNLLSTTHMIADVVGYIPTSSTSIVPLAPIRSMDTRIPQNSLGSPGPVGAGAQWTSTVGGSFGVPSNARGVVINLTGINPSGATFVTVWANGPAYPGTSNINLNTAGDVLANLTVTPLGTVGGMLGQDRFRNHAATIDVATDIQAYFPA